MARHATGPTTAKGKAISSQNARKHGLNAPPPEDPFDVDFTEFGLKQLGKLLVEVGRERRLCRRYFGEARA